MTLDIRVGLDLGQTADYSALIVSERVGEGRASVFVVRFAKRWRGVSYAVLVGEVGKILGRFAKDARIRFNLDATGVGRAVLDIFREAHAEGELCCSPRAITITSGSEPSRDGGMVPKVDLVARVETLLAADRLSVAPGVKLGPEIRRELAAFKAKTSSTGHHAFEAGGSAHDDLVLALAIALWGADESSPEALEKLSNLNLSLRPGNTYDKVGLAEPWRMGRVN
jgi:hypothetical protein